MRRIFFLLPFIHRIYKKETEVNMRFFILAHFSSFGVMALYSQPLHVAEYFGVHKPL